MSRLDGIRNLALYGKPGSGVKTSQHYLRQIVGPQVAVIGGIVSAEVAQRLREEDYALIEVRAPRQLRRDRLRAQRGRQPDETYNRLYGDVRADYSVINDGDEDWLLEQLLSIVEKEARRT